jgi:hypothetical protein
MCYRQSGTDRFHTRTHTHTHTHTHTLTYTEARVRIIQSLILLGTCAGDV